MCQRATYALQILLSIAVYSASMSIPSGLSRATRGGIYVVDMNRDQEHEVVGGQVSSCGRAKRQLPEFRDALLGILVAVPAHGAGELGPQTRVASGESRSHAALE